MTPDEKEEIRRTVQSGLGSAFYVTTDRSRQIEIMCDRGSGVWKFPLERRAYDSNEFNWLHQHDCQRATEKLKAYLKTIPKS